MTSWLPWLDRQGRFSWLRAVAFVLVLLPALWLAFDAWTGQLGSKPWTRAVHDTGTWAVRLLLVTLAISPLRRILDWGKLLGIRRMLGLSVMFYGLSHLLLYCIDLGFDGGLIVSEIVKRFYLLVGITTLTGLIALGATSTDGMIGRLGAVRWQRLHNLVYVITALALLHFALQSKIDVAQPALMAGLFALLMLYRMLPRLGITLDSARLALAALAAGLLTALAETAWYAFATGVPAWTVFQANADIVVYREWAALRPGHWVAFAGLVVAASSLFRASGARRTRRGPRQGERLSAQTGA